jgi:adenylate cyclase
MEKGHLSRKLAVLLHADVVGSTLLVQNNETLAHERIQDTFRRFSNTISSYGGVALEIRGDALVAEFGKVSDAVSASLAFQATNTVLNEKISDDIRPVLRIGIAMGEVVIADNTVTGEGIILAQRLEQLAEAGGVCVQGAAYETVPKRLPFDYKNLGEQQVKGFDETFRVYAVSLQPGGVIPESEAMGQANTETPEIPDRPSIAVLPFDNMSGDPEQEYFSDGITEDIITALSRVADLLVVARNSTLVYKGKAVDVKQVGREQGVRYVLEGSVRKGGNRVRVTAQLIDATTGHHQWARRYDRDLDDIFAVQDDITNQITIEMRVQLREGERARMLAGRTDSLEARELTFRADELNDRFVREANMEARLLVEEALRIDPLYASAWTRLGFIHWEDACFGWTESGAASDAKALEAAQRALELEEDYPDALALLGHVHALNGEHDRAVEVTEKAVVLAPNNSQNTAMLAAVLTYAGDADEAVEMFKKAIRLCPLNFAWHLYYLGMCYYSICELDLAIRTLRKALVLEPDSAYGRVWLTSALIDAGLVEDARQVAREIMRVDRKFSVTNWRGAQFRDTTLNKRIFDNLLTAGLPR